MLSGPARGNGEPAKFWLHVLTELKNRSVTDVFFIVCDGLKGLPDSVGAVFPHLIRNTFRYASKKYWGQIATDLKPIYRAPSRGRPRGQGSSLRPFVTVGAR